MSDQCLKAYSRACIDWRVHDLNFDVMATELIDTEKTGRIDYRKLFHGFFQTPTAIQRRDIWLSSRRIRCDVHADDVLY